MQLPSKRIELLERQIAQLKQQWPKHSVPAAMLLQLEALEEELEEARRQLANDISEQQSR